MTVPDAKPGREFTPSMELLRDEYVQMRAEHYGFSDLYAAEFDRALAQRDARIRAETLREAADDADALLDCECGHSLDEHNGSGCYARLTYIPLTTCKCRLTDDRTHGSLLTLRLRERADRIARKGQADDRP